MSSHVNQIALRIDRSSYARRTPHLNRWFENFILPVPRRAKICRPVSLVAGNRQLQVAESLGALTRPPVERVYEDVPAARICDCEAELARLLAFAEWAQRGCLAAVQQPVTYAESTRAARRILQVVQRSRSGLQPATPCMTSHSAPKPCASIVGPM